MTVPNPPQPALPLDSGVDLGSAPGEPVREEASALSGLPDSGGATDRAGGEAVGGDLDGEGVAPKPAGLRSAFSSGSILEQFGGPMGMLDSGLPVVVFVVVNVIAGLGWAIGAALAAGVAIALLRLLRHRPVTQAISGLIGVGIAAFIAWKLGSARGYFLVGIWTALIYGGALLLSVLIRWPLIGVAWEALNGRGTAWRADRRLVRRYDVATLIWVAVFAVRYLVQRFLYNRDDVGGLAVAKLLLGYPLWIIAAIATIAVVGSAGGMRMPSLRRKPSADPDTAD